MKLDINISIELDWETINVPIKKDIKIKKKLANKVKAKLIEEESELSDLNESVVLWYEQVLDTSKLTTEELQSKAIECMTILWSNWLSQKDIWKRTNISQPSLSHVNTRRIKQKWALIRTLNKLQNLVLIYNTAQ